MRIRVMVIPPEHNEHIEALRGLIERLSAPDLTLAEAKDLRGRLTALLEPGERRVRADAIAPSPTLVTPPDRGEAPRPELWSGDASMRVAG